MTTALTPVLICGARYTSSGQCAGPVLGIPAPQPSALAELGVPAFLGGLTYAAGEVFGAPSWLKIGAALASALVGFGATVEIEKKKVAASVARQLAAGTCLGQSRWWQDQYQHIGSSNFSNPPDSVLLACGFLPSEFTSIRAQLAALQAGSDATNAATTAATEKTFTTVSAALIAAFGL